MMEEEVLRGGFINNVVRVGDTVRRVPGHWTATIHVGRTSGDDRR
jgi:hypothetical protein